MFKPGLSSLTHIFNAKLSGRYFLRYPFEAKKDNLAISQPITIVSYNERLKLPHETEFSPSLNDAIASPNVRPKYDKKDEECSNQVCSLVTFLDRSNTRMHTNSMHILKRCDSGQTLIEIILALTVAVAVITGITFAITSSLKNATFIKNQNLATTYAQQGMETVRAIRDRSWAAFISLPGGPNFCLPENSTELVKRQGVDCDGEGNVGSFIREIRLNNNSSDCTTGAGNTKATVLVQWSDSKCTSPSNPFCHEVELVSCFANANVVPTP